MGTIPMKMMRFYDKICSTNFKSLLARRLINHCVIATRIKFLKSDSFSLCQNVIHLKTRHYSITHEKLQEVKPSNTNLDKQNRFKLSDLKEIEKIFKSLLKDIKDITEDVTKLLNVLQRMKGKPKKAEAEEDKKPPKSKFCRNKTLWALVISVS